MKARPILTKSISSLLFAGTMITAAQVAEGATFDWDGGGVAGTDLGTAVNWSGDLLPDVGLGDTLQWSGTVPGNLSLVYGNTAFAGSAGNPGVNLGITSGQTGALSIDSGANTGSFRVNDVTIAAGAGAFTIGDGSGAFNLTLGGAVGQTHTWTNNSSNIATVSSDVTFGLGGGGAHNLVLSGTGNWDLKNVVGQGNGVLTVIKSGAGTVTLSGANTYTGGVILNAGTLNVNNAAALGNTATGALTINGGVIDNTSGAAITTTTAKAQNWNGDFTFTGTNNLSFNGGTVTLGGNGNTRTVTISGGTLSAGSVTGTGYGLTKAGAGTLSLGTAVSRITGDLNITAGKVQIGAQDFLIGGGLNGGGTIENGSGTTRWLFVQGNGNSNFSGTIQNGAGAGTLGLSKAGAGTLTLTGTNSYTHQTTLNGGTLEFGSSSTAGITQTLSTVASTGLVFDRADSVVKSSFNGTGTASLTFGSRVLRTAGAAGNFVISGGTNGVDNRINLTQAAGFINQGLFFNGSNYAWMDAANTFVRGIAYGTDAGTVTSGAAVSLASATHQEFTGDITGQTSATFTTLKNSGNNALTLASGATVTVNGILKSGNVAGGAVISGGTGIQAANNAELVIRADGKNDVLTINTPILANGTSSLTTSGAGKLILGGTNTYTGVTTVNSAVELNGSIATGAVNITGGGTLTLNAGSTINPSNGNNGQFNVGSYAGGNAILVINGGTLNAGKTSNPSFVVGGSGNPGATGTANNVNGFVKMTSGTLTTAHELHVGNGSGTVGANAYAAFTMSGGNVVSGNWLVVGGTNGDRAVLNQSGGTITVNQNRMTIGAGGDTSLGIVNQSGGTLTVAAGGNTGIFLGENGFGNYTLSGTGELTLNTNGGATSGTMQFGGNGSSLGANFNLNGGTLTTSAVTKGASTANAVYRFNFNGGTLRANANNTAFFADLANTDAYVFAGGGTIDTNGNNVTIAEPLRAPAGSGLSSISVAAGGAGYVDQPIVTITGGSGTGATAIANVSGGVVTGFTITSPGTGYSPGDVLTVNLFGGGATTPASVGTVTVAANVSGGLNKTGAGTLTLTSANTYTGVTTVTGGELRLTNTGSLASSGVVINGTGAKLVNNGQGALTAPVTLTKGTLDGTGYFNSVTVGDGTGAVITHGDGTGNSLLFDALTFNGAAVVNLAPSTQVVPLYAQSLISGATNANGKVTINVTSPAGGWSLGNYNLIGYTTLGGKGLAGFQTGTVPGLGARQAASLSDVGGFIALTIGGDLPVWTGAQSGDWTTNTIGGVSNWKLQANGTATDFIAGDTVVFDDSATGTTTVNISTASVNPTSTTFDNSVLDYTISSTGGFGISGGSLIKKGAGKVTLTTANTYAGGTTLIDGTLNLNNASAIGTGTLTINGGAIDNTSAGAITLSTNNAQTWAGNFAFGGTKDLNLGTGAVSLAANVTVTTNGPAKLTVPGNIGGSGFGFTKAGAGEMVLSGANSYTGETNVSAGTLTLTGSLNASNTPNIGQVSVGTSFENATMRIVGGTVNATKTAAPSMVVGNSSSGAGVLIMDGGTINAPGELWVGSLLGGSGAMTLNAGTVTSGSWLPVGRNGTGLLNVTGGTLTVSSQNFSLGSFSGANGDVNLTGGVTSTTSTAANQGAFIVGEGGNGVLTVSGSAALNISGALGVQTARGSTGTGFVNLNGGTITTPAVTKGTGATGVFSFNGGTLRASAPNAAFMTGLTAAYVLPGGANIDTNGQNITIAQPLIAPVQSGVSSIAVSDGGSGYAHAPVVRIYGGSGTGATAVANIEGGVLKSITITNPGSGYAPDDFFYVSLEGGGSMIPATVGTVALTANSASGGLKKQGAGTLTLSGANTYGGATLVSGGTLELSATGSISASSGITINGAGAKLVQLNTTTPVSPVVNLTTGTLDGTGTVNSVIVGNGTGGVLANGNGGSGTLTIGSLTFGGAATVNVKTTGSVGLAVTGAMTTNAAGKVTLNVAAGIPLTTGSTYDLISFGTFSGTLGDFVLGTITGLGARQTPTPVLHGSNVGILINGDTPVWTGAASAAWTTATVGGASNWKLQTAGTATEFLANDQVIFDDTATGTTDVLINDATVAPASVTFNNSTKSYTVSGTGGITSGLLAKNGTGTVTINTANTYTGGTTVNEGTLILSGNNNFGTGTVTVNGGSATLSGSNTYSGATTVNGGSLKINNANALGASALTMNGGAIDNTSGGALTLTNATAQNWNGNFTFTGTNNLSFNNGAVTLGGGAGQRTVNVAGGTLSTGVIKSGAGIGLTKTGAGILAMTSTDNSSTIEGLLDVKEGTFKISGDLRVNGGLSGAGTIENGGPNSKWFFVNNPGDTTFSGTIRDNPDNPAIRLGLVKTGAGTLNLTGANNITTDRFAVEQGAVRITGTYTTGNGTGGDAVVGNVANQRASLIIDGGTLNANKTSSPSLNVGTTGNALGVIKMTSGAINAANELWIAGSANAYGALVMSGGTITSGSWMPVGRNGNGVADITGGTINVNAENFTTGSFGGANGVVNLSAGSINVLSTAANQGGFLVAEGGNATLNVSGTGALNISGARGLHFAAGSGTGIANLNGGTVTTPLVQKGAGTGILNFDGGTLKASAASTTFMQGLTAAYVNDGGAVIDDGGFAITVAQPLLAPTGSGVNSINFTPGGGYLGAPIVQIFGDGVGATAVANIDANGNLTGITVTNPGVGYTFASATLIGGGGTALADVANLATNISGGFTKKGTGTLTLSGANTYTGATVIESGTLALTGSISGSRSINVKSGAAFDVSGLVDGFSLAIEQTLTGSGSVKGSVIMSEGSKLAPGDTAGTLTLNGNLDLTLAVTPAGSKALVFDLAGPASSDKIAFASGGLSIGSGVLGFDDFTFTSSAGLVSGTYTLFDGNTAIIGTLNGANLSGSLGAGFSGTLGIADNGNDLVLTVVPEPGSATLLLAGLGSLLGVRRLRRRSL